MEEERVGRGCGLIIVVLLGGFVSRGTATKQKKESCLPDTPQLPTGSWYWSSRCGSWLLLAMRQCVGRVDDGPFSRLIRLSSNGTGGTPPVGKG